MESPRMAQTATGEGNQLIMNFRKSVYYFQCDNINECYWTKNEEYQLKIGRERHLMITVASSIVENCDCELDITGDCKCKVGLTGDDCDRCKDGYWGLDKDMTCKSKF